MLYRDYLKDKYQSTALKTAYAEGVPCVLESSKGKNIRNYEVYGNSVQDGTPSPESPVEIQSVGDLTTKNLINESAITLSSGYWSDSGGNQINNSGFIRISSVKCNPNETYTLSSNLKIYTIWFFNNDTSISKTYRENTVAAFTTPENCNSLRISLVNTSGNTDTIAFKWIQLELGSTATEYEPYHKYDIPITVCGKNLLPYPYYYNSRTLNGITFAIYDDGTIILNGTGEFDTVRIKDFMLLRNSDISAGTYTLSGCPTGGGVYSYRLFVTVYNYYSDGSPRYYNDMGRGTSIDVKENCKITITIRFGDEIGTVNNLVFKPQLEKGSSATEYEPYKGRITEHIYLDEPIRKVDDYSDYIDLKGQRVVRKVGVSDNTGTKPISESLGALAIPTEEPIALPVLKTFKGTNIISVDTSVQPSNIKAKYVRL